MLPSLPSLRAFDAAARLGSFREAASRLSVSPTAISHHVRGLEEQLGIRLFDRSGRRIALTEDGKRLAEATEQAFTVLEETVDTLQGRSRNVVRIAAGPIFTARWLMPRISDFWDRHPGIELEVVPSYRPMSVGGQGADIIIRWERVQNVSASAVKLLELRPVAVASPDFIRRHGPFRQPSDLLDVPILHQRDHWGWLDWFRALGVDTPDHLRGPVFEDANVLLRGAADGQGVILGWLPLIAQDISEKRIVRIFDENIPPSHGYFVEVPEARSTKRVRTVMNWLSEGQEPARQI